MSGHAGHVRHRRAQPLSLSVLEGLGRGKHHAVETRCRVSAVCECVWGSPPCMGDEALTPPTTHTPYTRTHMRARAHTHTHTCTHTLSTLPRTQPRRPRCDQPDEPGVCRRRGAHTHRDVGSKVHQEVPAGAAGAAAGRSCRSSSCCGAYGSAGGTACGSWLGGPRVCRGHGGHLGHHLCSGKVGGSTAAGCS